MVPGPTGTPSPLTLQAKGFKMKVLDALGLMVLNAPKLVFVKTNIQTEDIVQTPIQNDETPNTKH
jgi:hypothetical protein